MCRNLAALSQRSRFAIFILPSAPQLHDQHFQEKWVSKEPASRCPIMRSIWELVCKTEGWYALLLASELRGAKSPSNSQGLAWDCYFAKARQWIATQKWRLYWAWFLWSLATNEVASSKLGFCWGISACTESWAAAVLSSKSVASRF